MIEIRPACPKDAGILLANLHPVTRSEMENAGIPEENKTPFLKDIIAIPGASAAYVDGMLAFIAASRPYTPQAHTTTFLMAVCDDRSLALAARRWGRFERAAHPGKKAVIFSYSTHPDRDRFFAAFGMRKVSERPRFTVFSDSQDALDFPQ
jgi:hypothetical protein